MHLSRLSERVASSCAAADPSGIVSVWAGRVSGTAFFERDAMAAHYAASTMKLPLVLAVWRQVVRGELHLERRVAVHDTFASVRGGTPYSLDEADDQDPATWSAVGATRTVAELAESAIIQSGNLAANLLLDLVGLDAVADVLRRAGCTPLTVVARGIEDAPARSAGVTNTVTARDLGVLMAAIARRDDSLGGPRVSAAVEGLLARQSHRNQIPAGLPPGTPTASKSGWVTGVSHDVALVSPSDRAPFVLAVCTTTALDSAAAAALVAAIAHHVWDETGR